MESNNIFIIIGIVAIITFGMLWWGAKKAHTEEPQAPPKFEPRKMTDLSTEQTTAPVAPKKKHYRKNYEKKPIDGNKKPVGRPKKSE